MDLEIDSLIDSQSQSTLTQRLQGPAALDNSKTIQNLDLTGFIWMFVPKAFKQEILAADRWPSALVLLPPTLPLARQALAAQEWVP